MTGERNGCNGGMSRHRRFDPSNNLDGSTAALRKRFGERLLLALSCQLACSRIGLLRGADPTIVPTAPRQHFSDARLHEDEARDCSGPAKRSNIRLGF